MTNAILTTVRSAISQTQAHKGFAMVRSFASHLAVVGLFMLISASQGQAGVITMDFADFTSGPAPQTFVDRNLDVTVTAIGPGEPGLGSSGAVFGGSLGVFAGNDNGSFQVLVESNEALVFTFAKPVILRSLTLVGIFNNEAFTVGGFDADPGANENGSTAGFGFAGSTLSFNAAASGRAALAVLTIDFSNHVTASSLVFNTTGDGLGFQSLTALVPEPSTGLLATFGMLGMVFRRRKRG